MNALLTSTLSLSNNAIEAKTAENRVEEEFILKASDLIKSMCEEITAKSMSDLKPTPATSHKIIVTDGPPVREKQRVVPQSKREEFRALIRDMLKNGLIVPSESDWAAATQLVLKSDGSMRITIDFRRLNARTVKDAYPIPVITVILALLSEAMFYSKLDLMSGFIKSRMTKTA